MLHYDRITHYTTAPLPSSCSTRSASIYFRDCEEMGSLLDTPRYPIKRAGQSTSPGGRKPEILPPGKLLVRLNPLPSSVYRSCTIASIVLRSQLCIGLRPQGMSSRVR